MGEEEVVNMLMKIARLFALGALIAPLSSLTACQTVTDESGNKYSVATDSGAFKGTKVQSDGKSVPMELQGMNPTRIEYPTLGCSGRLELVTRTMNEVTFKENIESGSCSDGGTVVSSMAGRNVINLKWNNAGDSHAATAVLYRNGNKPSEKSASAVVAVPKSISSDQLSVMMEFGSPSDPYTKSGTVGMLGMKMADYTETYIDIPVKLELALKDEPSVAALKSAGKSVYATVVFAVRDTKLDQVDYINLPGNGTVCHQNLMIFSKENGYKASYNFKYQFAIRSDINARIIIDGKVVSRETGNIEEFYEITKISLSRFDIKKGEGRSVTCYGNADKNSWPVK